MGTIPNPVSVPALEVQSSTGIDGFTLQDATPTILSWTVPNDGNMHNCMLFGEVVVSSDTTGGAISINYLDPAGGSRTFTAFAGSYASTGAKSQSAGVQLSVAPNQTVTVTESTAQSAGAAIFYGTLWGL
jgi:hypothetical protein